MTLTVYPVMKSSGVDWLGAIPETWEVGQSRRVFAERKERARANDTQLTASQKHGVISQKRFMEIEGQKVVQVLEGYDILKHVEAGDYVISMRSFQGGLEMAREGGCISSAYVPLLSIKPLNKRYFGYLFKSAPYIQAIQSTSNLVRDGQAMRFTNFALVPLPIVPIEDQTAIAAFLDRETGKIDALVEEQGRLIELLKEKRQAVISYAVTKGLDPTAKMKPSGVEWLGDVPENWGAGVLKWELEFLTSGSRGWADHYSDEGPLFVRIGNLTRDSLGLDLADTQRVTVPAGSEGERTKLRSGDLLFSITAFLGSVAVVPEGFEEAYVSQHVALARLRSGRVLPRWAGYIALSWIGKTHLATQGYGGTKVQLSLDDVGSLPLLLPPLQEQETLANFIDDELLKLDGLTCSAEDAIRLLQERRSAIISAAVTGKIDVRGVTAEEVAA